MRTVDCTDAGSSEEVDTRVREALDIAVDASAIVTLVEFRELDETSLSMAQNVARWTIQNLRDERGFFYYQRRRFYTIRKPYMRWTQAWMLYALARLLESQSV